MADPKRLHGDALGAADDDGKEDAGEAAGGGGAPEAGDDAQGARAGAAADGKEAAGGATPESDAINVEEPPLLAGDLEAGGGGSKTDAVFAIFDKDGNGTISPSELRAAMVEVCVERN
jgi:hypothetical protein